MRDALARLLPLVPKRKPPQRPGPWLRTSLTLARSAARAAPQWLRAAVEDRATALSASSSIANGVRYDLAAAVWTKDIDRAFRLASQVRAGQVHITIAGQLARHAGARNVFGVVSTPAKAAYAKSFGYDDVFLESGWRARLDAATGARGVDVVLDSVGGDFRAEAIEVVAPMGRLVMFGNASGAPEVSPPAGVMRAQCKAAVGFSITGLTRLDPGRARRVTEAARRPRMTCESTSPKCFRSKTPGARTRRSKARAPPASSCCP